MTDFDELRLDRPPDEEPLSPRRSFPWLPVALAVVVIAGAAWYFFVRKPAPEDVAVRTETTKALEQTPDAGSKAEPGDNIPLPPLVETDALVRELVARLSSHPRVAAWLTTDQLIRNFTVVVVNISNGRTPAVHLKTVPPTGKFAVRQSGGEVLIDPKGYQRYDGHAEAVAALDARGAARLYATLKPRIDEAHQELGAPPGEFDRVLERAIVELLKTPVVEGDVRLEADSVSYTFADPKLESLSEAQRQLLRMGPRNVKMIQAKLRELAQYLGIPATSLPEETVVSR
jgi:Protein of unknown function (DUF3014)